MNALDRDAARDVLRGYYGRFTDAREGMALSALEGCVRPAPAQTIDRDQLINVLIEALGQHRLDGSVAVGALADRIITLSQPVDSVTFTRDEATWCRDLVSAECEAANGHPDYDDAGAHALIAKLEAAQ